MMRLSKRGFIRMLAGVSAAGAGAIWWRARPAALEQTIIRALRLAFGPDIMTDNDLQAFASELAPVLGTLLSADERQEAKEWFGNIHQDRGSEDDERWRVLRAIAEEKHQRISVTVAVAFVGSTDFAFDPQSRTVDYLGLGSQWPLQSGCSLLVNFDEDDGWPT